MICRRGLEIFILAFLFRLQGFVVTPGSHPVTIFRVDILNVMGPAIVVAGLVWGLLRSKPARVIWYALFAAAFAMVTPIVRSAPIVDALPVWLQWQVRPFGEFTIFTFFPWAGFVFAGGAVGALMTMARDERAERRLQAALGVVGAALVGVGFYTAGRPSIYASSSFWTSSPTWFAIRVGILMIALTVIHVVERLVGGDDTTPQNDSGLYRAFVVSWQRPLAMLGRNSLFVYWIHVELVYGYASWPWRHRLPLWGTAIAFGAFCALMYKAIGWRDLAVDRWSNRPAPPREASQAAIA